MDYQSSHSEFNSDHHDLDIVLLCDHVLLPANIGSVFRLADAYGVKSVIFLTEECKLSPKAKSVSRGTHNFVDYSMVDKINLESLGEDREWLCLEITNESKPLNELDLGSKKKIGVVIGNENKGVSEEFINSIRSYHIKMYGNNSSMNVSNSLSALLFNLTQR